MEKENIFDHLSGLLWRDENFDIASYRDTGVSPPDAITIPGTNILTVSFDGNATTEDIDVCKELNHEYAEGLPIYFHIHWYPTTTGLGNVKWQIEYYATHFGILAPVTGTISTLSAATGVAWEPLVTAFPAIDLGELGKIGTQIHFRLFRDPSDAEDTYGSDAAVATVGYHYQTNSRGSSKVFTK